MFYNKNYELKCVKRSLSSYVNADLIGLMSYRLVMEIIGIRKVWQYQTVEAINRRTDNTIAKRKKTKGQTTIYKTLYRKLKIDQHEPH
jgi:hypothetical protein